MATVADHRSIAASHQRRAAEARALALDVDRRRESLTHRLQPVIARHTDAVWSSRAATASRLRLYFTATSLLGRARDDLARTALDLRSTAEEHEASATTHLRFATEAEALSPAASPN